MTDADSTAGLTVVHDAVELVVGPDEGTDVVVLEDTAFVTLDGEVVTVGPTAEVLVDYPVENTETAIGTTDKTILPGFIDPYTYAFFAGDRSDELVAKLQGTTYEDVLANGGDILCTVDTVREVPDDELMMTLADHLDAILAHRTTTIEVKIGYGLDIETELRMLSVVDAAGSDHSVDVIPTFMGTHAVPHNAGAEEYIESVISDQLPAVVAQDITEFCDVFCKRGAFTAEQSHRILDTDRDHGLTLKIHAGEFAAIGGTDVATSTGATSTDHLFHTGDEDRDTLVGASVTPMLLPGTALDLGTDYADARAFLNAGHEVAFATDFNPGCSARSMGFVATLASVGIRMTPHEVIRGVTSAAAGTFDRDDGTGTLHTRTPVDAVMLDVSAVSRLSCRFDTSLVSTMLRSGVVARE